MVEFEPQCRIEGEIQQLEAGFPVTELAMCSPAKRRRVRSEREVTIFDSVGFALTDFSALRYLYRLNPRSADGGQRNRSRAGPGRSEGSVWRACARGRLSRQSAHGRPLTASRSRWLRVIDSRVGS